MSATTRRRPDPSTAALSEPPYFVYVVQEGDTLSELALKFFGDAKKWQDISVLNTSGALPDRLQVGSKIRIPCTWITVQQGDTLAAIAERTLGDSGRWRRIYEANRKVLPDPNKIGVGQRLAVPMETPASTAVGRGNGGHGGGHGGGRGRRSAYGGVYGPWGYGPAYSTGIEIDDDLLDPKEVAHRPLLVVVGDDLDYLGAETVGFDLSSVIPGGGEAGKAADGGFGFGTLFQTAGQLAQTGINIYEQHEADDKSSRDESARLTAALAADAAASGAAARAEVSAKLKTPSADVDKAASGQKAAAQDRAAAGLSPASAAKRAQAADDALAQVTAQVQNAPNNPMLLALMHAWTATANKAHNTSIVSAPSSRGGAVEAPRQDKGDAASPAEGLFARLLTWLHLK